MATWQKRVCLGVLLGWGLTGLATGADYKLDAKIDGVRLGKSILGPEVSNDDLKGKVVLLEFWGIN